MQMMQVGLGIQPIRFPCVGCDGGLLNKYFNSPGEALAFIVFVTFAALALIIFLHDRFKKK